MSQRLKDFVLGYATGILCALLAGYLAWIT
jgi:hypothetical protein